MKERVFPLILFLLMIVSASTVFAAEPVKPSPKDKCPVCGMFVYPFPQWTAQIVFKDGSHVLFDGPKDMFKYYFNVPKFDNKRAKDDIAEIFVTEYYTTKVMKAEDLLFVTGSDINGPMGAEIIPIYGRTAAETFLKDHHGKKIAKFDEIQSADIPGMK